MRLLDNWLSGLCLAILGTSVLAMRAISMEVSDMPLKMVEISAGVFVARGAIETADQENQGHIANIGFVVGSTAVAIIDTGGSRLVGARLRAAVKIRTNLPIKYVINSHMHPDHILGNIAFLPDEPEFVGHHKLAAAIAARASGYLEANGALLGEDVFAGTRIIAPTMPITKIRKLDLGNVVLRLEPMRTAHTDNDLTVVDEKSGIAWLGDLLFSGHLPVVDGSLNGWLKVVERLAGEKFTAVVPGHGPIQLDWPQAAEQQVAYLRKLRKDVRKLISDGRTLGEALKLVEPPARSSWQLVDEFHRRNISAAFAELEWE